MELKFVIPNMEKTFGNLEFLKDYKYSVIFTCDDFSSTLKKAKEIIPLENTYFLPY